MIDVYQNPEATRDLQIVATPTLVKMLPQPLRRIIGDLSDREKVLAGLDLGLDASGLGDELVMSAGEQDLSARHRVA